MIRIDLTQRQTRQLSKHLKMVRTAFRVGQRGTFVAQIQHDWWKGDSPAYVRAHFYPCALALPIIEAVAKARLPNCYQGIPVTAFMPRGNWWCKGCQKWHRDQSDHTSCAPSSPGRDT